MVDDKLTFSESGHKTIKINAFITAKIACKKLQFGPKKCFVIHTSREHEDVRNIELYFDGWEMKNVKDVETGIERRQDTFEGDMEVSHISSEKYLGQVISSDSKNTRNIEKIRNKGIGIQNRVIQMLEAMPGGQFHFEIAVLLRNT